ncbi:iron-sulfur cluster assembly protein [Bacillus sp. F19]|nr:iron-sulfur cluster assembly protein [Bacillus sp. F19]
MNKEEQVYKRLDKVHDPELDQPLTELGFIDSIDIDQDSVEVIFRLPAYWCSSNFAFIMAEDINKYVSELGWVKEVKVNLIDHCASDEINNGVKDRKRFSESFSKLSGGDLEELRQTFQIKAFYARQEKIIKYLLKNELSKKELFDHKTSLAFTTPDGMHSFEKHFQSICLEQNELSMDIGGQYCRGLYDLPAKPAER